MITPRTALAGGGGLLAAIAFVIGGAVGDSTNPNVADKATDPVIAVFAPAERLCPDGWTFESEKGPDARARFCIRGEWTVWLKEDGSFSHGWDGKSPDFVFAPADVPGWLR